MLKCKGKPLETIRMERSSKAAFLLVMGIMTATRLQLYFGTDVTHDPFLGSGGSRTKETLYPSSGLAKAALQPGG